MPKNYLLTYSEELASSIELLCKSIKAPSNTIFQLRKSSSSVYANIAEGNNPQSRADMISKFEIALKEASETENWLIIIKNAELINPNAIILLHKKLIKIKILLISSIKTLKDIN